MIIDDNKDVILVNDVQPKTTSLGMTMGAPPQYRNTDRFRIPTSCRLPRMSIIMSSLCPSHIYEKVRLKSMKQTLPYTAK
jgi:hypothetical protein